MRGEQKKKIREIILSHIYGDTIIDKTKHARRVAGCHCDMGYFDIREAERLAKSPSMVRGGLLNLESLIKKEGGSFVNAQKSIARVILDLVGRNEKSRLELVLPHFKERFRAADGRLKNKVLFDLIKSNKIKRYLNPTQREELYSLDSMALMVQFCERMILQSPIGKYCVPVMECEFSSDIYAPSNCGLCHDGDIRSFRYKNMERDEQVFKMRIGKMMKHLILSSEFGKLLPESVVIFMCEEYSRRWQSWASKRMPNRCETLVVDDDFAAIYDSKQCFGDFGSCMTDNDQYKFYECDVDAKAAKLIDKNGDIVARCIIFTDVIDVNTEEKLRLAERQYASDGNDLLKQMLVDMLIDGGYIDGYKKVGADSHSPRNWMKTDHTPFPSDMLLKIRCRTEIGDVISYQDSFQWYDMDSGWAYNFPASGYTHDLATTERYLEGGNFDEYNDCYTTSELVQVLVNGRSMMCSEDDLEDFRYVEDIGYCHEDDVVWCGNCNDYVLHDDSYYSELTGEYYCCESCLEDAEQKYKERYYEWSEFDSDYFEDVENYYVWNGDDYEESTISKGSLDGLIERGLIVEIDGEYYDSPENIEERK